VPPARSAILRWFGLSSVHVVRVDKLPPTRRLEATDLGDRTTFAAAQRRARFKLRRLAGSRPDSVYVAPTSTGVRVTLVYGSVDKPRVLLGEFRGVGTAKFVEKYATEGTTIERVRVAGNPGLWFSGAPHAVMYFDPDYPRLIYQDVPLLAGNTLVWESGALTFRIEGDLSKADALELARKLR
jgi:hypothetical protein